MSVFADKLNAPTVDLFCAMVLLLLLLPGLSIGKGHLVCSEIDRAIHMGNGICQEYSSTSAQMIDLYSRWRAFSEVITNHRICQFDNGFNGITYVIYPNSPELPAWKCEQAPAENNDLEKKEKSRFFLNQVETDIGNINPYPVNDDETLVVDTPSAPGSGGSPGDSYPGRKRPGPPPGFMLPDAFGVEVLSTGILPVAVIPFAFNLDQPSLPEQQVMFQHGLMIDGTEVLILVNGPEVVQYRRRSLLGNWSQYRRSAILPVEQNDSSSGIKKDWLIRGLIYLCSNQLIEPQQYGGGGKSSNTSQGDKKTDSGTSGRAVPNTSSQSQGSASGQWSADNQESQRHPNSKQRCESCNVILNSVNSRPKEKLCMECLTSSSPNGQEPPSQARDMAEEGYLQYLEFLKQEFHNARERYRHRSKPSGFMKEDGDNKRISDFIRKANPELAKAITKMNHMLDDIRDGDDSVTTAQAIEMFDRVYTLYDSFIRSEAGLDRYAGVLSKLESWMKKISQQPLIILLRMDGTFWHDIIITVSKLDEIKAASKPDIVTLPQSSPTPGKAVTAQAGTEALLTLFEKQLQAINDSEINSEHALVLYDKLEGARKLIGRILLDNLLLSPACYPASFSRLAAILRKYKRPLLLLEQKIYPGIAVANKFVDVMISSSQVSGVYASEDKNDETETGKTLRAADVSDREKSLVLYNDMLVGERVALISSMVGDNNSGKGGKNFFSRMLTGLAQSGKMDSITGAPLLLAAAQNTGQATGTGEHRELVRAAQSMLLPRGHDGQIIAEQIMDVSGVSFHIDPRDRSQVILRSPLGDLAITPSRMMYALLQTGEASIFTLIRGTQSFQLRYVEGIAQHINNQLMLHRRRQGYLHTGNRLEQARKFLELSESAEIPGLSTQQPSGHYDAKKILTKALKFLRF